MSRYSLDLRNKVINYNKVIDYIKKGNSVYKTSNTFVVEERTIFYWKNLHKKANLKPKSNTIRKPKKLNPKLLEEYIQNNQEKTIKQIAEYFSVWRVRFSVNFSL